MKIWRWVHNLWKLWSGDTPQPTVRTGSVKSKNGGVAAGNIGSGAIVTVNNLSVSKSAIRRYAQPLGLPPQQAEKVVSGFLQDIETYYRYLPLKGMGDNSGLRLRFPLVDLYVPLNARLTLPRGDTLPDELRVAGRRLSKEEREHIDGGLDDLRPMLELIQEHPVLVILGDPGSGKSTVLRFLAYTLATGQGSAFGLAAFLPLLLPLSAYSEALALSRKTSLNLRQFTLEYFSTRMDTDNLDALLDSHLERGKVLILLDGLDEVKDISQRNLVVERVHAFLSKYARKGNRAILTSRIVGYKEVRPPEIAGLRECTLLDFELNEIKGFIRRWTGVIESQAYKDPHIARYEAEREAQELVEAVEDNEAVARLAANPLLLTMLVIQKRQGGQLPRHRVLLYERCVSSLLEDWLMNRNIHAATANKLPQERGLRRILEPLAWWLQESEPGKGLVAEVDMIEWLKKHPSVMGNDDEQRAHQLIRDVREHSGLLIDRGGKKFGFLHLTFMEYLAAVWLANQVQREDGLQDIVNTMRKYAAISEWREVLLLAVEHIGLNLRLELSATQLLRELLAIHNDGGAAKAIAAAALADIGADGVAPEDWDLFKENILEQGVCGADVVAEHRAGIARSLAIMGDPRKEVSDVDAMRFCSVPAGKFYMGRGKHDPEIQFDLPETPAGEYDLDYDYWLAKHPVTVAQFRQFVKEREFKPENTGTLRRSANTPIVSISQLEALAFCEWLNHRWQEMGVLPTGWRVTLPNEPEWEKAARGGFKLPKQAVDWTADQGGLPTRPAGVDSPNPQPERRYPWGNELTDEHANHPENIGAVSAIGVFSRGASPYGCHDLIGNVFEWTRSEEADYPYPTVGTEEWAQRERSQAASCVMRSVRCAARTSFKPDRSLPIVGFRVVLSPIALLDKTLK